MKKKITKKIKAWAFLATEKGVPYFITDAHNEAEIYTKKPKNRDNPFAYFGGGKGKWKANEIEITFKFAPHKVKRE